MKREIVELRDEVNALKTELIQPLPQPTPPPPAHLDPGLAS